ncbi:MAG: tachylectin-related carbohydrate-binding protein [Acidobacteriota bacterium]
MPFTISYNGNGSDGGTPPVDPHGPYNPGETVPIQLPGSLTKSGAKFAYWNTQPNGSGTFYGWPLVAPLLMPGNNVTLYAQWFVTTGLTNGGRTKHYAFFYDSSLRASGLEPGRTNALIKAAEGDFAIMAAWFPGVTASGPSPHPVFVTRLTGGANNTGDIRLKPSSNDVNELRAYLVSEITESFMQGQNKGWGFLPGIDNEESCGEALSLFLTQRFEQSQGIAGPYTAFTANGWLNTSLPAGHPNSTRIVKNADGSTTDFGSRFDYVNSVLPYPGNGPGTGCSMLFLYYLVSQLGYSIEEIISAAPGYKNGVLDAIAPLRGVYQNLTGDHGDPFPAFKQLLDNAFPPDKVSTIPGTTTGDPDNPFPLGVLPMVKTVFSGGDGIVYAVLDNGDLLWYRHDGKDDGSFRWVHSHGRKVGVGWDFKTVFSGGDGVIYGVTHTGDLMWFRHDGRGDGTFRWTDNTGRKVGVGWAYKTVFSGGDGVIYGITHTGELMWFRHDGRGDGTFRWTNTKGRKVGVGWSMPQVFFG